MKTKPKAKQIGNVDHLKQPIKKHLDRIYLKNTLKN